jgi:hypothetical protein
LGESAQRNVDVDSFYGISVFAVSRLRARGGDVPCVQVYAHDLTAKLTEALVIVGGRG